VIILIALIAPGAYILLSKKLRGTSEPNYMPDPRHTTAAFNQPLPVPPGLPRVEPPEVRLWVSNLLQDRIHPKAAIPRDAERSPIMSDTFRTQFLQWVPATEKSATVWLMVWDDRASITASQPTIQIYQPAAATASSRNVSQIDVTQTVRDALQRVGYVNPPTRVWLIEANYESTPTAPSPSRIELIYSDAAGRATVETITLATPIKVATP
jgi:hypothetical protein